MIQTGSFIHQRQAFRQIDTESPLVITPSELFPVLRPIVPPGCQAARDRFDDQNGRALFRDSDEISSKPLAQCRVEFVDRESSDDCSVCRNAQPADLCSLRSSANAQLL